VKQKRPKGGLMFFDVSDSTWLTPVQFAAKRDEVSTDSWDRLQKLQEGHRVEAIGRLGPNRAGKLVAWVTTSPLVQAPISDKSLSTAAPEQRRVGQSIITAAVRSETEALLTSNGFVGILARTLSTNWPNGSGLRPLFAQYPGFGNSAYIAPSPSPQLVDAIIVSGANRVFTSSHCFTTSYRDDLDGVETDLVMAKAIDATLLALITLSEALVGRIGRYLGAEPLIDRRLTVHASDWPSLESTGSGFPEVVIAHIGPGQNEEPPLAFRVFVAPDVAPIEGAMEPFAGPVVMSTLSVFPSRFLPLAEHTPIRRIYPLGAAPHEG
jgi:hypothetical protein